MCSKNATLCLEIYLFIFIFLKFLFLKKKKKEKKQRGAGSCAWRSTGAAVHVLTESSAVEAGVTQRGGNLASRAGRRRWAAAAATALISASLAG